MTSRLPRIGLQIATLGTKTAGAWQRAARQVLARYQDARRLEPLELSQVFTRFAVGLVITLYTAITISMGAAATQLLLMLAAAWVIGFALLIHLLLKPQDRVVRRSVSIASDAIALSLLIHLGGHAAAIFFPIYIWIILGNGFRFGVSYMYFSMVMNVVCFLIMVAFTAYWKESLQFTAGLLIAIVAIPIYTSSLIIKLRGAMAQAKAASQAKNEFLSMISHELRTPLNSILGLAQISRINAGTVQERQNAAFTEISANRLKRMLDSILKFQAIEAGTSHINKIDFSLFDILAETEAILAPLAAKKRINLAFRFRTPIPEFLFSDPDILQTLVINIAGNAIKYTKKGFVIVESMLILADETKLRIEIHDSGPGIDANLSNRIFEQFTRYLPTQVKDEGGVGLGLSLCKSLIQLMQGQIGFESEPGKGACFWFEVPVDKQLSSSPGATGGTAALFGADPSSLTSFAQELEVLGDAEAEPGLPRLLDARRAPTVLIAEPAKLSNQEMERLQKSMHSAPHQPLIVVDRSGNGTSDLALQASVIVGSIDAITPGLVATATKWQQRICGGSLKATETASRSGKTVLVADDDQMNRQVVCRMLALDGHTIIEAGTGEEAVERLLSEEIEIAFLDVNMPDLDGVEACKTYLSFVNPALAAKIIGVTADISEHTRLRCLAAGMKQVLTKPLSLAELRASLATESTDETEAPGNKKEAAQNDAVDCDRIDLLAEILGEDELKTSLLPSFEEETTFRIEQLRTFSKDSRLSDVRAVLHAIKSSATTIGATQLTKTVMLLENGRPGEAQPSYDDLSAELVKFMSSCKSLLERRAGRETKPGAVHQS
jgi:two-component system, sensor histidine kinase RpfC